MSETGNIIKKAHDILVQGGNCAQMFYQEETGEHCAWGALNRALTGNYQPLFDFRRAQVNQAFLALDRHVPESFGGVVDSFPWGETREQVNARARVVAYNNRNPGQPVIDLFAKAAADEGYDCG